LWLIKVWFSASTFVVKIATFAKPETVTSKRKERHDHQQTTLTRQTISLFLDTIQPDFSDTQADPKGFKKFSNRTF
jgi:hypothetical protein